MRGEVNGDRISIIHDGGVTAVSTKDIDPNVLIRLKSVFPDTFSVSEAKTESQGLTSSKLEQLRPSSRKGELKLANDSSMSVIDVVAAIKDYGVSGLRFGSTIQEFRKTFPRAKGPVADSLGEYGPGVEVWLLPPVLNADIFGVTFANGKLYAIGLGYQKESSQNIRDALLDKYGFPKGIQLGRVATVRWEFPSADRDVFLTDYPDSRSLSARVVVYLASARRAVEADERSNAASNQAISGHSGLVSPRTEPASSPTPSPIVVPGDNLGAYESMRAIGFNRRVVMLNVTADDLEAIRRKADEGDLLACYYLALKCNSGQGEEKDKIEASKWATILFLDRVQRYGAKDIRTKEAGAVLEEIESEMSPAEKDEAAKRVEKFHKS